MRAQVAIAVLFALAAAAPALAQAPAYYGRAEPSRAPSDMPGARAVENRAHVTSSAAATEPTPAEQRQARALAAALFAAPAAAQRAAHNAAPEPAPEWANVTPRPEWVDPPTGLLPGGRGMKITTPF